MKARAALGNGIARLGQKRGECLVFEGTDMGIEAATAGHGVGESAKSGILRENANQGAPV